MERTTDSSSANRTDSFTEKQHREHPLSSEQTGYETEGPLSVLDPSKKPGGRDGDVGTSSTGNNDSNDS